MADHSPLTVTCDFFHEFEDDATGFKEENPATGVSPSTGFPGPAELTAAKALWVNAVLQWAVPSVDAPHRLVISKAQPGGIEVMVRVGRASPGAITPPAEKTVRATTIDTASDQFVT